jgi:hypothetical protein
MSDAPTVFTLEAVNALVPRLKALVAVQMERRVEIEERLRELEKLVGANGEIAPKTPGESARVQSLKRDLSERVESYESAWREVTEMGAVLKDARRGLVDFYGQVDGKLVWLCWCYGENAVTHYHSLDEGFAGRRPIEATMRQRHLN